MRRDPFPRRTATVGALAPWLGEALATLPTAARIYGPASALGARAREAIMLEVTEVNGCRYCAFIHGEWRDFLGDAGGDLDEAVRRYARACAEAGRPLPTDALADVLPVDARAELRATVVQIEVANLVGNTVDGLLARLTRKRPIQPLIAAQELAALAMAAPVALPLVGVAAGLSIVRRIAPELPDIDMPEAGEANLLTHLLAQAAPRYLANAAVRLAVLGSPVEVGVGLRAGRTASTVTVGRGRLQVANGITSDAWVVVEGEVEPLLKLASGTIDHELGTIRLRPG